jgi:hypothetical protein
MLEVKSFFCMGVSFTETDFDHIFFEPVSEEDRKGKFSVRRAKKMYFIKAILQGIVSGELTYQDERGTFGLFCRDLDCVIYLRHRVGTSSLQIGTFIDFGHNHEKMYMKQRKKARQISKEEFREIIKKESC